MDSFLLSHCVPEIPHALRRQKLLSGWKRLSCCRQTHTFTDAQKLRVLLLQDRSQTDTQAAGLSPPSHLMTVPKTCLSHDLNKLGKLSFQHDIICHTASHTPKRVKLRKMLVQSDHSYQEAMTAKHIKGKKQSEESALLLHGSFSRKIFLLLKLEAVCRESKHSLGFL